MKQHIKRLSPAFLLAILMIASGNAAGQTGGAITLQQAIEYGISHNANLQRSQLEIDKNDYRRTEARAGYLPQVNGSVQVLENLKLQTQILPGEFFGQPGTQIPVQFGTKYNINALVDANQAIFDQGQIYNMRLTRQNNEVAQLNFAKTKEQLTYDIATAYYSAQISLAQRQLVTDNLVKLDSLVKITNVQFENGFATKLDLDRLIVSQTNQRTQLASSQSNYQQQLLLLKYYMGLPLDAAIEVPAIGLDEMPTQGVVNTETLNTTELSLVQAQRGIYETNLRQVNGGYFPSLTANFRYMYMFQQNEFRVFTGGNWFPSSYIGLTLNVPIFDGLSRYARSSQMKLQIKQSELDEQYLTESLRMQRANAQTQLSTNLASLESQRRNIELAEEVFRTTEVQFKGGIASMTDLVNAESSLKEAQANYLQALVQVKLSDLDLIRATGNINTIK
jgi:outer membrane protein